MKFGFSNISGVFEPSSDPVSTPIDGVRALKQGSSSDLASKKFSSGVVGVRVRHNSMDKSDGSEDDEEVSDSPHKKHHIKTCFIID